MTPLEVRTLTRSDSVWPLQLDYRLGDSGPSRLWSIGNPEILQRRKVGVFCSAKCPDGVMVAAEEAARKFCEAGAIVISGFQSPVEKGCLRVLLEESQPVVVCPARALQGFRIPTEWRQAL